MSPEVYTKLEKIGGALVIVMRRIEPAHSLQACLKQKKILEEDAFKIGHALGKKLIDLPRGSQRAPRILERFIGRIEELESRERLLARSIPKKEWRRYTSFLKAFLAEHKDTLVEPLQGRVRNVGDLHSDNVFYRDKKLLLLDTYPVDPEYVFDHVAPVYRLAMDFWVLGNEKLYRSFIRGISKSAPELIDPRFETYWVVYGSVIEVSYRYMLRHTGLAKRFHWFLKTYMASILNP